MFITIGKKQIIMIIAIAIIVISIPFIYTSFSDIVLTTNTNSNTNWGLSFKENGKTPVGNATSEFLKQYDAYFVNDKKIYITFDAGFENGNTTAILDALKKHNVKATFFVVGTFIKLNPDIVKQIVNEGHMIGNHTMTHPNMSKMSTIEDFKKEIEPVVKLYKDCIGKDMPKFYRPPQGIYSQQNLKMAKELGYKTIFWSLAYVDWYQDKQPTKEQAFEKLIPRIHPGAIILLHSTSKTNATILDEFLTKIENQGYYFGTLDELT